MKLYHIESTRPNQIDQVLIAIKDDLPDGGKRALEEADGIVPDPAIIAVYTVIPRSGHRMELNELRPFVG